MSVTLENDHLLIYDKVKSTLISNSHFIFESSNSVFYFLNIVEIVNYKGL